MRHGVYIRLRGCGRADVPIVYEYLHVCVLTFGVVRCQHRYLAGTAVRDIGLTIAGGEPPVWSQYQYKDGKGGSGGNSPAGATGSPILAVSMSAKGGSGGGGGGKKGLPSSPRAKGRGGSSLRVGSPSKATSSPLGSPRSRSRKAQASSPMKGKQQPPQDLTGIGVNFTGAGGFGSARVKAQNSLRGRLPFGN